MHYTDLPDDVYNTLMQGTVIPAHPLLLDEERRVDEARQRAMTRYYLDAGAGGIAVGVHTTQFAIRERGLYEPVLDLAAETARAWSTQETVLVAGVTGRTEDAVKEATMARGLGYHVALLNLAHYRGASESEILDHCRRTATVMPLVGFSLLPACGGFHLSYDFWRSFAAIDNVVAIKMAPFDRYRTLDIIRGLVDAGREGQIALYTGNDDHIVLDLLSPVHMRSHAGTTEVRIRGGLLGHWSVWTATAVRLFRTIRAACDQRTVATDLLALDSVVTQSNAAIYDALHDLKGAIPGCLEVLRRQGLAKNVLCLDPNEQLSPGQADAIERVYQAFPELNDDAFVSANLDRWMSDASEPPPLTIPA